MNKFRLLGSIAILNDPTEDQISVIQRAVYNRDGTWRAREDINLSMQVDKSWSNSVIIKFWCDETKAKECVEYLNEIINRGCG